MAVEIEEPKKEEEKKDDKDDPFKYKPPTFFDRMGELFVFFSVLNAAVIWAMEKPYDLTERFALYGLVEVTLLVVSILGGALTNSAPPVPEGLEDMLKAKRDAEKEGKKGIETRDSDKEKAA